MTEPRRRTPGQQLRDSLRTAETSRAAESLYGYRGCRVTLDGLSCYGEAPSSNGGTTVLFNRSPIKGKTPLNLFMVNGVVGSLKVIYGADNAGPPDMTKVSFTSHSLPRAPAAAP